MNTTATTPIVKGTYLHYKGNRYVVHGEVRHSETEETLVLYCPEKSPDDWWVRPKAMFLETVTVDNATVPRFALIDDA